jgi:hypothetical protein
LNYFLHHILDAIPQNHYHNLGLLLPDMAKHFVANFRHLHTHNMYHIQLATGCAQHLETDKRFHASSFFEHYSMLINQMLKNGNFSSSFKRKWFVAHVLFELMLDRAMVKTYPHLVDEMYDGLYQISISELQSFITANNCINVEIFIQRFEHFRDVAFIRYYTDNNKLIYSLDRVMQKVRLPMLQENDKQILMKIIVDLEKCYFAEGKKLLHEIKEIFR